MNRLTFLKLFAATPFAMAGVKAAKPSPYLRFTRGVLATASAAYEAETRRVLQECIRLQRHTYRNIKSIGEALKA